MADLHRFGVCSYLLKNDLKQAIYELLQVEEHIFGIMSVEFLYTNYKCGQMWEVRDKIEKVEGTYNYCTLGNNYAAKFNWFTHWW